MKSYSNALVLFILVDILLLIGDSYASSSTPPSLVLSPVEVPRQCECRNGMLDALTPVDSPPGQMPTEIVITGFFSFDSNNSTCGVYRSNISSYLIPAALVALDEINNSSDILSGYHLKLDIRDSRCDPIHAITELSDSISAGLTNPNQSSNFNLGILGPGCPEVTKTIAGIISRSVKLPVVSYGFSLPALGDHQNFLTLFNTARLLLHTMRSAIGLLRHFNWTNNIAFVSEDSDDVFLSTTENVIKTNASNNMILTDGISNISISVFEKLAISLSDDIKISNLVQMFVDNIRMDNVRVIVGLLSQRHAAQVMCKARHGIIPGNGFVYVFVGTYSENWWKTETNHCNLTSYDVQSVFIVSGSVTDSNFTSIINSSNTLDNFVGEFSLRLRKWCSEPPTEIIAFAGSVYDSVWSLALALNKSRDQIDLALNNGLHYDSNTLSAIVRSLESTNFSGITGTVKFNQGERDGPDSIQQIQNGSQLLVGWYIDNKVVLTQDLIWNGSDTIPSDTPTMIYINVAPHWLVIVSIFVFGGIIFGLFMCIFNAYYSNHRILRATAQKLNYVILIGVFFGFLSIVILTFLDSPLGLKMSEDLFRALCIIRIWMLPLSFTFTYGVIFVRAWRIYRVFNNPWKRARPYKDYHLLLFVLGIAVGDALILIPWTIIDPYRRFTIESELDYNSFSQSVSFSCSSDKSIIWLAILAVYKIAIITAGFVVISLVRKEVKERKIFDDTRSLAIAAYVASTSFIVGLTLTLLFLLADQVTYSYLVSAIWVNIALSGILICVFLTKFYRITIKKDSGSQYKRARKLYYGEGTMYNAPSKVVSSQISVATASRLSPDESLSPSTSSASHSNLVSGDRNNLRSKYVTYSIDTDNGTDL